VRRPGGNTFRAALDRTIMTAKESAGKPSAEPLRHSEPFAFCHPELMQGHKLGNSELSMVPTEADLMQVFSAPNVT
jgi:hypothetical protein